MSDIPCIVSRRSAGRFADTLRVHALLHTQRLSCPVCPRQLERLIASLLRHMPNNWVNSLHPPYYPCWVLGGFAEVNLFLGIDVQYEVYIRRPGWEDKKIHGGPALALVGSASFQEINMDD
jgi:hypothetical protein